MAPTNGRKISTLKIGILNILAANLASKRHFHHLFSRAAKRGGSWWNKDVALDQITQQALVQAYQSPHVTQEKSSPMTANPAVLWSHARALTTLP